MNINGNPSPCTQGGEDIGGGGSGGGNGITNPYTGDLVIFGSVTADAAITQPLQLTTKDYVDNSGGNPQAILDLEEKTQNMTGLVGETTFSGDTIVDNLTVNSENITLGFEAGLTNQSLFDTIAIGTSAGKTNQQDSCIAIGKSAGRDDQQFSAIAIGINSGLSNQGEDSVAIGNGGGRVSQGESSIAIGAAAGINSQGDNAVAMGTLSASLNQGEKSVAIGFYAGQNIQGNHALAIGDLAGTDTQGLNGIALGRSAGGTNQGSNSVAIGYLSGLANQGENAIAIGNTSGNNNQGIGCIAIGRRAGQTNQATNSIAIGEGSGNVNQLANSIIINATGLDVNSTVANSLYIDPIRNVDNSNFVKYNSTTKEVTYSNSSSSLEIGTKAQLLAKTGMTEGQQFYMNANPGTSFTSQENKLWTYTGRTWQVIGETIEMLASENMIEGNTVEVGTTADYQISLTNTSQDVNVIGVVALKGLLANQWGTMATRGLWEVACVTDTYNRASYLNTSSTNGLAQETVSVSAKPFAKIVENRTTIIQGSLVFAVLHTCEIY